ncbi:hypothetical protein AOLI_G00212500 [Acnodon oligacanthus]
MKPVLGCSFSKQRSNVWQGVPHAPALLGALCWTASISKQRLQRGWRKQTWRDRAELAGPQKVASARRCPVISRLRQAGAARKEEKRAG